MNICVFVVFICALCSCTVLYCTLLYTCRRHRTCATNTRDLRACEQLLAMRLAASLAFLCVVVIRLVLVVGIQSLHNRLCSQLKGAKVRVCVSVVAMLATIG